ncbi:MAG: SIR2 family NAD-dependent protein deacylase [Phycisphaerae bacterium]
MNGDELDPQLEQQAALEAAARAISRAASICVSTGAGMSAESGIATFRDRDGAWSKFNPAELATPEGFRRDPLKVWEWYRARRKQLTECTPHEGYRVLARWESRFERFDLITQNVDGFHRQVGCKRVIELHGRLDQARCIACEHVCVGPDDLGPDPKCPTCGSRLRPGVVWFGEMLPEGAIEAAFAAAESCDVFLVIGTSGVVQPAASLALAARERGATVIEINPQATELSSVAHIAIRAGSRTALRDIECLL